MKVDGVDVGVDRDIDCWWTVTQRRTMGAREPWNTNEPRKPNWACSYDQPTPFWIPSVRIIIRAPSSSSSIPASDPFIELPLHSGAGTWTFPFRSTADPPSWHPPTKRRRRSLPAHQPVSPGEVMTRNSTKVDASGSHSWSLGPSSCPCWPPFRGHDCASAWG